MEQSNNSEVARLMRQITEEYEAAQRGLTGLAYGTAQHAFITAKMERMVTMQESLSEIVGSQKAISLVVQAINDANVG